MGSVLRHLVGLPPPSPLSGGIPGVSRRVGFFRVGLAGIADVDGQGSSYIPYIHAYQRSVRQIFGQVHIVDHGKIVDCFSGCPGVLSRAESTGSVPLFSSLRLYPVGPLTNHLVRRAAPTTFRGDPWTAQYSLCMDWLDRCPPASVLYVSLGSVVALEPEQVAEMAEGQNDSGRRFLRELKQAKLTVDTWLPAGFETDIAGRGLVVRWSPQEKVLSDPAVAVFLTHCGWNSTLETLAAGKPVVPFPSFGDQTTNAKFLVDVLGVGVRMSEPVRAAEVGRCAAELFDGPRAEEMREQAAKWKEASATTLADCGDSYGNLQLFFSDITSMDGTADRP